MVRKYLLYLARWQLSTPILAICVWLLVTRVGTAWATAVANLVGGLIFFWVDRWIFRNMTLLRGELWEAQVHVVCADCGKGVDKGYRLVKARKYDKTGDRQPEFRCHECSRAKYRRDRGGAEVGTLRG
jgi:hypothetical protein